MSLSANDLSTPPWIRQKVPVPAQAMHFRKPRRSTPSAFKLSLMKSDIAPSLLTGSPCIPAPRIAFTCLYRPGTQNIPGISRRRGLCRHRTAPLVENGLWSGQLEQNHIGEVLLSFEDNFTAVWGDVEAVNVEVGSEVGELPFGARLQINEPEILMLNLSSQEYECGSSRQEGYVSCAPSECQGRQAVG